MVDKVNNPLTRQDFTTGTLPGEVAKDGEEIGGVSRTLLGAETIKAKDVAEFERKEEFEPVRKSSPSKIFYNQLAESLNKMKVGDILLFPLPENMLAHNLKKVMSNRGARDGVDIQYGRARKDFQGRTLPMKLRPMTVKKLTACIITVFPLAVKNKVKE